MNPIREPAAAPPVVLSDAQERDKKQLLTAAEDLDKKLQASRRDWSRRHCATAMTSTSSSLMGFISISSGSMPRLEPVAAMSREARISRPRETQLNLLRTYESEVASVDSDYQKILQNDFPPFDQALQRASLAPLVGGAGNQ